MVNLLSIIYLSINIFSKSKKIEENEVSPTITLGNSEIAIFKTLRNRKIEQKARRRTHQREKQHIYIELILNFIIMIIVSFKFVFFSVYRAQLGRILSGSWKSSGRHLKLPLFFRGSYTNVHLISQERTISVIRLLRCPICFANWAFEKGFEKK